MGDRAMDDLDQDSSLSDVPSHLDSPRLRRHPGDAEYAPSDEGDGSLGQGLHMQDHEMADHDDNDDDEAADGGAASHYPRRKRTSLFTDLSESKIEIPTSIRQERTALPTSGSRPKHQRASLGVGGKGVLLGHWRDSPAPTLEDRHAVIGFIDIRDRLRTRIQHTNKNGDHVNDKWPMPAGPGGSWVTFERIHFSDHLIGLDHYQVKEFVRIRAGLGEETQEEQDENINAAIAEATQRGREAALQDHSSGQPQIACGASAQAPPAADQPRPEIKRRRTSASFVPVNFESDSTQQEAPPVDRQPLDPLYGTRPTRILIGYWKGSSEEDPRNRHAVVGILGQNDMFRVKVLRETRDGRYMDGNFPTGAGALWIHYEEVVFEPHLEHLTRNEVKEYCRVRQYQLDQGETTEEQETNKLKAVEDARIRTSASNWQPLTYFTRVTNPGQPPQGAIVRGPSAEKEPRPPRPYETGANKFRIAPTEAQERASVQARREIARAEAAQNRADRHSSHRDSTVDSSASTPTSTAMGGVVRGSLQDSEEMQRLNQLWARQESARIRTAGSDDAKMHDGIKYERKATGPFQGKLVSQGTIISIDGEDYVEYRVLTKPTFF